MAGDLDDLSFGDEQQWIVDGVARSDQSFGGEGLHINVLIKANCDLDENCISLLRFLMRASATLQPWSARRGARGKPLKQDAILLIAWKSPRHSDRGYLCSFSL